jgi:broad specificity phosphatase PhoE
VSPPFQQTLDQAPRRRRAYLLRHAAVSYFDADGKPLDPRSVPLSDRGVAQAHTMRDALQGVAFDRIVCSGMPRSRQTAEILARGQPIEDVPGLREIRAGRLREVAAEALEQTVAYPYDGIGEQGATFLGGDTYLEFQERVLRAWEALLGDLNWNRLLLVSHDVVNRVILAWALRADLSVIAALEQDACCMNIVDVDMNGGVVTRRFIRAINVTPYDLAKAGIHSTHMEDIFRSYKR